MKSKKKLSKKKKKSNLIKFQTCYIVIRPNKKTSILNLKQIKCWRMK
jgi:hypothetical protein